MKNKKKGFTIVELVIVIAVIGILSAILIPTFVGLTNNAQEAARQENMRNAYYSYAADAAEDENLELHEEVEIVLSEANAIDANAKFYKINEKGKWVLGTYDNTKTYTELGTYNGYHVFYVA